MDKIMSYRQKGFEKIGLIIIYFDSIIPVKKETMEESMKGIIRQGNGYLQDKRNGILRCRPLFPDYSEKDKVLAYAVLGGIPHYLNQFNSELSAQENIKRNILTKGSVLYSEVDFLLHQELREIPIYNFIMEVVALGNTKLNDIS